MILDYAATGLSLKAHPVSLMRDGLDRFNVIPNRLLSDIGACPHGKPVTVAGIVLVRQRPGTASGVVFMTIEDETGVANLILWPKVYDRFRRDARHSAAVMARGTVERDSMNGQVVHVTVRSIRDIGDWIEPIATKSRDFH